MTRWAFIGAGAMAGAMVRSLLSQEVATAADIRCIGGADPTAANLSRDTGISAVETFDELLEGADILLVACKPQNLSNLPTALAGLTAGKLVVSILAGTKLSTLAAKFPNARNLIRVMPNTPAQIGAGVSGWCPLKRLADSDRALALALLNALGKQVEVDEDSMDAVTAVSGSGPAYVFEFTAALTAGAIAAGLDEKTADLLARETVLGAARLMEQSDASPDSLRDRVTSPNGTTYAALQVLGERGFRDMINDAVAAAKKRSIELSAGN
jgi:pyrroline-5-carboxylate reductase